MLPESKIFQVQNLSPCARQLRERRRVDLTPILEHRLQSDTQHLGVQILLKTQPKQFWLLQCSHCRPARYVEVRGANALTKRMARADSRKAQEDAVRTPGSRKSHLQKLS